jgi:hypothetical protein
MGQAKTHYAGTDFATNGFTKAFGKTTQADKDLAGSRCSFPYKHSIHPSDMFPICCKYYQYPYKTIIKKSVSSSIDSM